MAVNIIRNDHAVIVSLRHKYDRLVVLSRSVWPVEEHFVYVKGGFHVATKFGK